MKVKSLTIYPVKGIAGINVLKSVVRERGLQYDREYMLADKSGNLISQRTIPKMCLMTPERLDAGWLITYNDNSIIISDGTIANNIIAVDLWDTVVECKEVSTLHSNWFSNQLDIDCYLVKMPFIDSRKKTLIKPPYETTLSFADGYPVLILGTQSMEYLNAKLTYKMKENRFRPNIYIETELPHQEDDWEDFRVGNEVTFRSIKPCVRCAVITVDQETGLAGKEPSKTLASYRRDGNEINFGSNVIVLNGGTIAVGDSIKPINKE